MKNILFYEQEKKIYKNRNIYRLFIDLMIAGSFCLKSEARQTKWNMQFCSRIFSLLYVWKNAPQFKRLGLKKMKQFSNKSSNLMAWHQFGSEAVVLQCYGILTPRCMCVIVIWWQCHLFAKSEKQVCHITSDCIYVFSTILFKIIKNGL